MKSAQLWELCCAANLCPLLGQGLWNQGQRWPGSTPGGVGLDPGFSHTHTHTHRWTRSHLGSTGPTGLAWPCGRRAQTPPDYGPVCAPAGRELLLTGNALLRRKGSALFGPAHWPQSRRVRKTCRYVSPRSVPPRNSSCLRRKSMLSKSTHPSSPPP